MFFSFVIDAYSRKVVGWQEALALEAKMKRVHISTWATAGASPSSGRS